MDENDARRRKMLHDISKVPYLVECDITLNFRRSFYMSLKDTTKHLKDLLCNIASDLEKADGGNKAASQRVRTGTVKLEKIAKAFRKESISNERKTQGQKRPAKAKAKHAAKPKAAKAHAHAHPKAKKPAHKAKASKAAFHARALSVKRASAKLPTKRFGFR